MSPDVSITLARDLGVLPEIVNEIESAIEHAHTRLLAKFAADPPNTHRLEIRLFRALLKRVIKWSGQDEELDRLTYQVRWWESYWYQREYGDSQFENLDDKDRQRVSDLEQAFLRNHIKIWAATIDHAELASQLIPASIQDQVSLSALNAISELPTLSELRLVLQNATPVISELLLETVVKTVASLKPESMTQNFLYFLAALYPRSNVVWGSKGDHLSIELATQYSHAITKNQGALGREARAWIAQQISNNDLDQKVELETASDAIHFVLDKLEAA
jgi:HEPN domain-containing protein